MGDGVFPSVSVQGHSSEKVFLFSTAVEFAYSASSIFLETLLDSGFEMPCTELLNVCEDLSSLRSDVTSLDMETLIISCIESSLTPLK